MRFKNVRESMSHLCGCMHVRMPQGEDVTRDMLFISTKAGFTTPKLVSKLIQVRAC
jgi:hypothetical protein